MFFMIEGEVLDAEERIELLKKLRHHGTPYKNIGSIVSIETRLQSRTAVDKIVSYFEKAGAIRKSVFIIGEPFEVVQ